MYDWNEAVRSLNVGLPSDRSELCCGKKIVCS